MEKVHNQADLIIAKQRHGPTGTIQLFFEAEFTRFADLDLHHAGHDSEAPHPALSRGGGVEAPSPLRERAG